MALIKLDQSSWRRSFSRILWNGPPLSGKTTGTLTLPRPCHLLVAPGELGYSSVLPESDYHIYAWEYDANAMNANPKEIWKEVNQTVTDILQGKHGPVQSLVFDGLHKLYDLVMRVEGWQPNMIDDKEAGKQYVKYHATFGSFLSRMLGSGIALVGATCYDGLEPIEAGSKITQIFPMLPGKMAKEVMGMFPVVFHTSQEGQKYYWALRATGKMQAAGLHVPTRMINMIPERIEIVVDRKTGEVKGGWREIEKILEPLEAMVELARP